MIDLRSDTVTQPNESMRQAMMSASVGDDVYGEDPSINELEEFAAHLLNKKAGLYLPSGTQSNLAALLTHCQRGDEYIVGQDAHTYRFEGGGAAVLGSIQPQPIHFEPDGTLAIDQITSVIKPHDSHFARSKLVCLENTQAGKALGLGYIEQVRDLCNKHNLNLHLDGARFFNACADKSLKPAALAEPFDSVSICLSKGLGAPMGSILLGNKEFINEARRWRKVLGGGMRQAGIMAAGGLYALKHNLSRLSEDHDNASLIHKALIEHFGPGSATCATNMVHLSLDQKVYSIFQSYLLSHEIKVSTQRWVFHLDISKSQVERLIEVVRQFKF
jgi:threonine aldolase